MRSVGKLLCAAVALALLLWLGVFARTQFRHLGVSKISRSAFAGRRADSYVAENKARKVYPLSVVPGGVYSSEELARSRRIDSVVAKHYAGFGNSVSVQKTVQDTYMYMSYRKDDKVYWTKTKHRIPRGEYVFTDGKGFARARCGNRLSPVPEEPVMNAGEPGDDRLDKPEPPGGTYLASLEPAMSDPLFSIPASTDEQPVLDVPSNSPKSAATPQSAFTGNGGGPPIPAGGFGSTPYVLPRSGASTPSSSSRLPSNTSNGGGTTAVIATIPTPEPTSLTLLSTGGVGLLICFRALRRSY